jgi:hypothetical protein
MAKYVCGVELTWQIIYFNVFQDGEMSTKHIYSMATIKLTNVYIVDLIKILVIENNGDMCVVKGLHCLHLLRTQMGAVFKN